MCIRDRQPPRYDWGWSGGRQMSSDVGEVHGTSCRVPFPCLTLRQDLLRPVDANPLGAPRQTWARPTLHFPGDARFLCLR
eukprot:11825331-Alexandrium_andersonii.AAC.1